jgi:uncharacterized membrane protein YqhA
MSARPGDTRQPSDRVDPDISPAQVTGHAIGMSRFVIALAIFGTILSSLSLLVFALIVDVKSIWAAFSHGDFTVEASKHLAVQLIETTDLFLFGMVLYVIAMGMYQLFIDPNIDVPAWMRVRGLSDLKTQLLNVIVVLLAVTFLASAVSWTSGNAIFYYGLAIGAIIIALAAYQVAQHVTHSDDDH